MATDRDMTQAREPIVDRRVRPKTIVRLVALVAGLIAAAVLFVIVRDRLDPNVVLGILGLFAVIGIFFLVSAAIGVIQFMPRSDPDPLARAFLNGQTDGTLITDRWGRVIYANHAYGTMTGATKASEIRSVESLLSDSREASEAVYRITNRLRDGKAGREEFRLAKPLDRTIGGEERARWYRLSGRPLETGRAPSEKYHVWQIADISAERNEQEHFFNELQHAIDYLDHAPAGFFSADSDGSLVYINATLADWLSLDLTKFEPGSVSLSDMIAGDGMALIESVRAEPGRNNTATIDLDLRKTSGQSVPVRLIHRVSALRDGAPGESRTIVLARSGVDSGLSAEAAGAAAETRFTRFFNNTPMAIASVDGEGRVLRTNAPFLKVFSGLVTREELENGAAFDSLLHERDRPAFRAALIDACNGQGDIPPVDGRHPANPERHFRLYVNAVIDHAETREEAAIIYVVETTEQKALETQMAQTQKMNAVGTLAGGIAHDFNNVLTAILLSADHLLLSLRPADAGFADLMEIKRNANRAAVLVRQLLAFSRKQTMRPTVLSMTDVIGDLRMLVDRLTGPDVRLEIDYGHDLWPVMTDLGQFEQVMINLCVNARDAMPDGGTVTIRTRNMPAAEVEALNYRGLEASDHVLIEVEDEGTGIPADILDQIFEPFFTTKEVGKGTGLGLSMVYGIVKQSGGYIYPISKVGQGTTFQIFLPRHVEVAAETPAAMPALAGDKPEEADARAGTAQADGASEDRPADAPEPAMTSTTSPKADVQQPSAPEPERAVDLTGNAVVLLVEDEEAVRRGGKRMLETRGYTVHEAVSGIEALEVMEELDGKVDIVVSDVVMPEMDGPTLLRELRKDHPDLKFVFVSGYAEEAFAKNLPADANFGFLPKPFSLKQLAITVAETLKQT